jgi:4-amino-4-deoxy-L-arabinose transferase-like glycosyltransferase
MSRERSYTLIMVTLAAALAVYLAGNGRVGLWDRDEPRYAQASRQMLQSGDWVTPRFLDAWRAKKPPLIYWCQATSMSILGDTAAAARLPSVIAIELTAILIAIGLGRCVGPARAAWTVLIFCTSALVVAAAKMSITDAVQLLWIVICQACLVRLRTDERDRLNTGLMIPILFWISLGLGLLTKGMIPLVLIASMIALAILEVGADWTNRSAWKAAAHWWLRTRPLIGLPVMLAVVGPWIYLIHARSPGFLSNLGNEAAGHSVAAAEGHGGFPGYHTLLIGGTFFPWVLFLPATIHSAFVHRRRYEIRLAIAAFIGPWVVMESLSTRLPHYVLPAFAPLAFLTADALQRALDGEAGNLINRRALLIGGTAILCLVVVGFAIAPWVLALHFSSVPLIPLAISSSLCLISAASVAAMLRYRQIAGMALVMGFGMLVAFGATYALFIPAAPYLQISIPVAGAVSALGYDPSQGRVAMIDYKEPSLAFALQGHAYEADDDALKSMAAHSMPAWAVTTRRDFDSLPEPIRSRLKVVWENQAISYNGATRTVEVLVVRPASSTSH